MVIYIIHFKVQKNKIGIVLVLLSTDLIQNEGVSCSYSSWKINFGAISYLMNFFDRNSHAWKWKVLTQSERVKTKVD